MDSVLVIDTGSQSMRGMLISTSGSILHAKQISYFMNVEGALAEQDSADFKDALYDICRDISSFLLINNAYSLTGIVLTSQRSSVVAVDKDGSPLHPILMWYDSRSQYICDRINAQNGSEIFSTCGILASPVMAAPKMTLIREQMPDIYRRSYKLLTIHDYLLFLLTGRFVTDHSFASRTCLFDISNLCWSDDMAALFNLDKSKLCELCEPGSIVGSLTGSFCGQTSLPPVPVITGGGDQQCAVLGQGLLEQGDVSVNTGTGAYVISICDAPVFGVPGRVNLSCSAVPGKWLLEASTMSSGSVYKWFNACFYPEQSTNDGFAVIDRDVSMTPPGANGILMLPDLAGKGCPDWDNNAKGVFCGLSFASGRADCARAVLEGIAAEISECYIILSKMIPNAANIRSTGGLSKSDVFSQMIADMIEFPVSRSSIKESTAAGAWINAVVALGYYSSRRDAFLAFSQTVMIDTFTPQINTAAIYQRLLAVRRILEDAMPNEALERYRTEILSIQQETD